MEFGLLWYDGNPKRPLEDKIELAAARYREKFGRWPNTCYVHPQAVDGESEDGLHLAYRTRNPRAMIHVLSAPNILLHHFWLGEHKDDTPQSRARAS